MGFKIISDVLLTKDQLMRAVREAELDQMSNPELANLVPGRVTSPEDRENRNEYYVRLVEEDPFEYLVFTVEEVMHILKLRMHFTGSRAALCNILRQAKVPFADDDDEDEDDDDD